MRNAEPAVQPVGERRVEIDLYQDRHGEQHDHERLLEDLRALEAEQQHERRKQRPEREGLQRRERARSRSSAPQKSL